MTAYKHRPLILTLTYLKVIKDRGLLLEAKWDAMGNEKIGALFQFKVAAEFLCFGHPFGEATVEQGKREGVRLRSLLHRCLIGWSTKPAMSFGEALAEAPPRTPKVTAQPRSRPVSPVLTAKSRSPSPPRVSLSASSPPTNRSSGSESFREEATGRSVSLSKTDGWSSNSVIGQGKKELLSEFRNEELSPEDEDALDWFDRAGGAGYFGN